MLNDTVTAVTKKMLRYGKELCEDTTFSVPQQ